MVYILQDYNPLIQCVLNCPISNSVFSIVASVSTRLSGIGYASPNSSVETIVKIPYGREFIHLLCYRIAQGKLEARTRKTVFIDLSAELEPRLTFL